MEARAGDAARPQGRQPPGRSRAAHPRPRGLLNHLIPNPGDEPFLAQIYAAPEDDAPRQVFADALTERGDPRGEFIALQLARARGPVTPAQLARERELCAPQEHRIAWARPVSKGGTCHLSRGFPDELMIEPRQLDGLLEHPAVSTLHTVTGLNQVVDDAQVKTFLLQASASRLRSVEGLSLGVVESLEAPLRWPSVGLAFNPAAAHREHLLEVKELSIAAQLRPVSEECFVGLTGLKRLKVVRSSPGAFAPLTGLVHLEAKDWRSQGDWARELAGLPRLERLELGTTVTPLQLRGLKLKALACWTSSELDVDALLEGLPGLQELRLWCGTGQATAHTLAKLLSCERLGQLRFVSAGIFELSRPRTAEASLEVRAWSQQKLEDHAPALELVPAGSVAKAIVRPREADPWALAGPPPPGFEALRAAAKVPLELAWY